MITFDAGPGMGYLWCSARVPQILATTNQSVTQYELPPMSFSLPPADSRWYPTDVRYDNGLPGGPRALYGPRLGNMEVGELNSVKNNADDPNPCIHSTVNGHICLRGLDGTNAPFIPRSTAPALVADVLYELQGSGFGGTAYTQKALLQPTNNSWNYLVDKFGDTFVKKWSTAPTIVDHYSNYTYVYPELTHPSSQSTLPTGGVFKKYGSWYGAKFAGGKPSTVNEGTYLYCATYSRPSRTLVRRVFAIETHQTSSYTPATLKNTFCLTTGLGSCYSAIVQRDEIEITHVRSTARGIFQIRCFISNYWDKHVWNGSTETIYTEGFSETTKEYTLKVLYPTSSTDTYRPDTSSIDAYCARERARAQWFRDSVSMTEARTAAVNDTVELDSNWIENLSSIKGTIKIFQPLLTAWKAYKSKDLRLAKKALAEAYLSYLYVIKPAINDYKNVSSDGKRILDQATAPAGTKERRRGRVITQVSAAGVDATCYFTCTIHLTMKNDIFSRIWVALEKLGLQPSSSQLWDCVPLSFVADWFLHIGDTLERLDNYASLLVHWYVDSCIEGFKVSWHMSESDYSQAFAIGAVACGKPVSYVFYHRTVSPEIGQVDIISSQLGNGLTLSQICQGTALISLYKKP